LLDPLRSQTRLADKALEFGDLSRGVDSSEGSHRAGLKQLDLLTNPMIPSLQEESGGGVLLGQVLQGGGVARGWEKALKELTEMESKESTRHRCGRGEGGDGLEEDHVDLQDGLLKDLHTGGEDAGEGRDGSSCWR
jgi:hypothetical protein